MSEHEPTEQDLQRALVVPGFELPSTITKHRSVVMTRGLQPEDLGVLDYLKLRDPRLPATKEQLSAEMQQELGWKMGKTRFDGIFGRLKAAGHIKHHCPYNPETGRPEWVIEFFLEPTNNDQYVNSGIEEASQVAAGFLETRVSGFARSFESPETSVSRGQEGSQVSGDPEGNPWNPAFPSGAVLAGQSRNPENPLSGVHPPHPPVGGGNPPPDPHTDANSGSNEREGEESSAINDEQITAAADFLQELPDPWRAGRSTARKLAPELAVAAQEQGWDLDEALAKKLTFNPDGIRSYSKVLAMRIRDLPRKGTSGLPRQQKAQRVPELPKDRVPSEEGILAARAAYEAFRRGTGRL